MNGRLASPWWRKAYLAFHMMLSGAMVLKQGMADADTLKVLFAISSLCAVWVLFDRSLRDWKKPNQEAI